MITALTLWVLDKSTWFLKNEMAIAWILGWACVTLSLAADLAIVRLLWRMG